MILLPSTICSYISLKKNQVVNDNVHVSLSHENVLQYNCLHFNYSYISLPNYIFILPY